MALYGAPLVGGSGRRISSGYRLVPTKSAPASENDSARLGPRWEDGEKEFVPRDFAV